MKTPQCAVIPFVSLYSDYMDKRANWVIAFYFILHCLFPQEEERKYTGSQFKAQGWNPTKWTLNRIEAQLLPWSSILWHYPACEVHIKLTEYMLLINSREWVSFSLSTAKYVSVIIWTIRNLSCELNWVNPGTGKNFYDPPTNPISLYLLSVEIGRIPLSDNRKSSHTSPGTHQVPTRTTLHYFCLATESTDKTVDAVLMRAGERASLTVMYMPTCIRTH